MQKQPVANPLFVTLCRFNKVISEVWGADRVFRFFYYGSKIFANLLVKRRPDLSANFSKFASQISNGRVINRLLGSFETLQFLISSREEKDKTTRYLYYVDALSLLAYYQFELVYWLNAIGVWKNIDGDWFSIWSSRFWAIELISELMLDFLSLRSYSHSLQQWRNHPPQLGDEKSKEEEDKMKQIEKTSFQTKVRCVKNIGDMILALHWSREKPLVSDMNVGLIGFVGSLCGWYIKWVNTKV
eukprot:TRINITY_DN1564_c0_g1_i1.p1 TRINITY_DN1564_c0_g1~~TRINITY_DN1564_c0_g1_i1.p1  ORF type:complete len:256 (+),score=31.12 TRINITY_DN1564_c0_g1_i1:42-770(+)